MNSPGNIILINYPQILNSASCAEEDKISSDKAVGDPCEIPPWNSMKIHGNPWKSMEIHGAPWNAMEFQGVP